MGLSQHLTWMDVALRLALTIVAGVLIGYDRSERGKVAGLRTTLLVCLAASVAMIQVNLLLPTAGRQPDSFVMNDLMRLPLGILTGVGFIGGGAILRRDNMVVGVTTAATLWLVTVIGLCLGGGQIGLGIAATALGLFGLWGLKGLESRMQQDFSAQLSIEVDDDGIPEAAIREALRAAGLRIRNSDESISHATSRRLHIFDLVQRHRADDATTPQVVKELSQKAGVVSLHWRGRRRG